ncbi:RF-1 domain-containing protein [Mucidula mucida]|nr:RF-1 domain-containing protein [Mucidula mucida]
MTALNAAARSAYRQLFRASRKTFAGDVPVLQAFQGKMRLDAEALGIHPSPTALQEYTDNTLSVTQFLTRNVLQATRVDDAVWRLQIKKETELGDNASIKTPPPIPESSRQARKRAKAQTALDADVLSPPPERRMNYSVLKKVSKERTIPELNEADLEESFVRGSGPGGQSVNKTENNVQLVHKPTGLRVACQETRSLEQNRRLARRWLLEKLDRQINPGLSNEELKKARQNERERRRRKKAKKRALGKVVAQSDFI